MNDKDENSITNEQLEQVEKKQKYNKQKKAILVAAFLGSAMLSFITYSQLSNINKEETATAHTVANQLKKINEKPPIALDYNKSPLKNTENEIVNTNENHPSTKEETTIHKATFIGGERKLRAFLVKNVKYPKRALKKQIEGLVIAKITIDEKGDIIESKILKGIGHGCDQAILNAIKKMPKWKPAQSNGTETKGEYNISFKFKIPN